MDHRATRVVQDCIADCDASKVCRVPRHEGLSAVRDAHPAGREGVRCLLQATDPCVRCRESGRIAWTYTRESRSTALAEFDVRPITVRGRWQARTGEMMNRIEASCIASLHPPRDERLVANLDAEGDAAATSSIPTAAVEASPIGPNRPSSQLAGGRPGSAVTRDLAAARRAAAAVQTCRSTRHRSKFRDTATSNAIEGMSPSTGSATIDLSSQQGVYATNAGRRHEGPASTAYVPDRFRDVSDWTAAIRISQPRKVVGSVRTTTARLMTHHDGPENQSLHVLCKRGSNASHAHHKAIA
jgi:hypothetical protein